MKHKWQIIHDCDDDNGEPTCWAREVNHPKYGRFVWIHEDGGHSYTVEVIPDRDARILATCRSLASAKRWVTVNIG